MGYYATVGFVLGDGISCAEGSDTIWRIEPVFRDEEELPADADLESPIFNALDRSKFLIVICSPRAVESTYVAAEINYFDAFPAASRDPEGEYQRAVLFNNRGSVLASQGKLDAAREALERALAIFRRRSAADADNSTYRYDAANTLIKLGGIASKQGDLPGAARQLREAEEILSGVGLDETGAKKFAREAAAKLGPWPVCKVQTSTLLKSNLRGVTAEP